MDEVRLNPVRCLAGMLVASIGLAGRTSRSYSTPTAGPCGCGSAKTPSLVAPWEMSPHAISATASTDRG